jgi:hypothetical protein
MLLQSPAVLFSVLVVALWSFGDAVLGFSLHLLHIVIEVLELGLEHLLESLFHLEGHAAQMWTAWIGLTLLMALGLFSYRHARSVLAAHFPSWRHFGRSAKNWAREHWRELGLPLLSFLVSVTLF